MRHELLGEEEASLLGRLTQGDEEELWPHWRWRLSILCDDGLDDPLDAGAKAKGGEVGAVEQWSNPETGSRGTVELTRI